MDGWKECKKERKKQRSEETKNPDRQISTNFKHLEVLAISWHLNDKASWRLGESETRLKHGFLEELLDRRYDQTIVFLHEDLVKIGLMMGRKKRQLGVVRGS